MEGHRTFLAMLERTMPPAGEARRAAALRLCRAMGLVRSEADERDREGMTRLMKGASEGMSLNTLRALVRGARLRQLARARCRAFLPCYPFLPRFTIRAVSLA